MISEKYDLNSTGGN